MVVGCGCVGVCGVGVVWVCGCGVWVWCVGVVCGCVVVGVVFDGLLPGFIQGKRLVSDCVEIDIFQVDAANG